MINNKTGKKLFTIESAESIGNQFGVTRNKYNHEQFMAGPEIEHRHGIIDPEITSNDFIMTGNVVIARLNEFPDYYNKPVKVKNNQTNASIRINKRYAVDASVDSIVDPPFTETYGGSYKKNIREENKLLMDDK